MWEDHRADVLARIYDETDDDDDDDDGFFLVMHDTQSRQRE